MAYQAETKKNYLQLFILFLSALLIYYPVFYEEFAYTDELTGLWQWNTGKFDSTHVLYQYGRLITAKLAAWLYSTNDTIADLKFIRIFSFVGWLACIPVWYYTFKKIMHQENLPQIFSFFSVFYLICMPSFAISIGWAACFEMFIANTAGLISGYFLYAGISYENNRFKVSSLFTAISFLTGIVSLFTYQNCFGCFLLPFLLHFISTAKVTRQLIIGIGAYFIIYIVYYMLFRYSLKVNHLGMSERTGVHINPGNKLLYFFTRPLSSAFHFTYLFNEKSIPGFIIYIVTAGSWLLISFYRLKGKMIIEKLKYLITTFCLLCLIFLPSLIVKENYASNRTLLPLSMAVFLLAGHVLLTTIKDIKIKRYAVIICLLLFIVNAWYNFNYQFLKPVKKEYKQLSDFLVANYKSGIDTICVIRPPEDFFVRKYGITRSWDEFGVPSTFFDWTPRFFVKQIVFEKTRNRDIAEKLVVKSWPDNASFLQSGDSVNQHSLLVDVQKIMAGAE